MEEIKVLVGEGEILEALSKLASIIPDKYRDELVLLRARFSRIQKKENKGIIGQGQFNLERNRIEASLLALISQIGPGIATTGKNKHTRDSNGASNSTKILFISANPARSNSLQLGLEYKKILQCYKMGQKSENFDILEPVMAATMKDFISSFALKPNIIHFSGHANPGGMVISNSENRRRLLSIRNMFELADMDSEQMKLIIFNACESDDLAKEVSKSNIYCSGNSQKIADAAAIHFTEGFYSGLFNGFDIVSSLKAGLLTVATEKPKFEAGIKVWKQGEELQL